MHPIPRWERYSKEMPERNKSYFDQKYAVPPHLSFSMSDLVRLFIFSKQKKVYNKNTSQLLKNYFEWGAYFETSLND